MRPQIMTTNNCLRTNAMALAQRSLWRGQPIRILKRTRELARDQLTITAGARRWQSYSGLGSQRMMSTNSLLRKKPPIRPIPKPPEMLGVIKPGTFLFVGGVMVFVMAAYSAMLHSSYKKTVSSYASLEIPADVSDRWDDKMAESFDSDVGLMEKWLGISKIRKNLVAQATGDVCEVSIGTGRNLTYYPWDFGEKYEKIWSTVWLPGGGEKGKRGKVKSFTAVDKSKEMLEVAHEKFGKEYPGVIGIRWIIQDASEPLPAPPLSADERSGNKVGKKFDTIVQTFGLCSIADPVGLLKNLGESVEPDGRILLLEHGKGEYEWINNILDRLAPAHADRFGCWWNKDIGKIVKDSGLEVVEIRRRHFGTTWWVVLKPKNSEKPRKEDRR